MIKVKNLKKSFNNKPILKGISCEFEKGKTSLIIGQSGSGKTVFLNLDRNLYEVYLITISPDSWTAIDDNKSTFEVSKGDFSLKNGRVRFYKENNLTYSGIAILHREIFKNYTALKFKLVDVFLEKRNSSFRIPVLAAAVGIYLPIQLTFPVFIGGIISYLSIKKMNNKYKIHKKAIRNEQ